MKLTSISYSIPYIIMFCILIFLSIPVGITKGQTKAFTDKIRLFVISILLIIFFGLRGFVYSDCFPYYECFLHSPTLYDGYSKINHFFNNYYFEKGYLLLNIFIKSIFNNWYFFQLVNYIIDFCILYHFFKKIVPELIILCFCFYFIFSGLFMEINLMRNIKSILLFICSLKYIRQKRFFPYLMLNMLGFLFHATALIFIPLYFLLNNKVNKKLLLIIFIIGNFIFLAQIPLAKILVGLIGKVFFGRIASIAISYLEYKATATGNGISIGYLERIFTFIIMYKNYNKLLSNKNNIIFYNCFLIYIYVNLYLADMSIITDRVSILFIFPYWILYPQIYHFQNKQNKILFLFIFLAYSILKMISGNRTLICAYDNLLFPLYSYDERKAMLMTYWNSIQ